MIIWIILLVYFIYGVTTLSSGRIQTSRKRQVEGRVAFVVGMTMLLIPFLVVGAGTAIGIAGAFLKWSPDTIQNSALIVSLLLIVLPAIVLALNLKRWSVPIPGQDDSPDFSKFHVRDAEPDFEFLAQEDNDSKS